MTTDSGNEDVAGKNVAAEPDRSSSASSDRSKLSAWLIGLATVLAVVSIFSTWVRVQALDTDAWVDLSDELLQDPDVQETLSTYIVDQLFDQIDVSAEIEDGLPENLQVLAGSLSAALRGPATDAVQGVISSDQFRSAWLAANRSAHQLMINILREETAPALSTSDGSVVLELGEVVRVVGEKLGLSESVLDRLPDDVGHVTILESEDLKSAQAAVRVLDFMSWFTLVVVVALYAAAVYVANGRRLRVLRNVGISMIGVGVGVLLLRTIATRLVLDQVVENPERLSVADATAQISTGLIRQVAWSALIYGLLVLCLASLLGGHRWARAVRDAIAPIVRGSVGSLVAATSGLLLVLIWWSPGRAFDRWVSAVILVGLTIAAVVALRRADTDAPVDAIREKTPA